MKRIPLPTLYQLEVAWHRSIVPAIREQSIPASTLFADARPIWVSPGRLVVEFARESAFHAQQAKVERNTALLEAAVHEVTGRRLRVRIVCDSVIYEDEPEGFTETYAEYLRSDHWQHMRQLAREHYGSNCVLCGSANNLDVHHRTYERKGRELLRDLILLCRDCHSTYHQKSA